MFLTYQFAPVWVTLVSMLTFLTLRFFDPVDLNQHKDKMGGYPPAICCVCVVIPLIVAVLYEVGLRLGPKASKTGIKM